MKTPTEIEKQIKTHGETLLAIFPNSREQDHVELFNKLSQIEAIAERAAVDYGLICYDQWENVQKATVAKLANLFGCNEAKLIECGFFVDGDPRGYALKFCANWTEEFNDTRIEQGLPELHCDCDGFGILAPDFSNN